LIGSSLPTSASLKAFDGSQLNGTGVDVMITIFLQFFPIFCGKSGGFLKTYYDQNVSKTNNCLRIKTPIF
jgi:hypothetical protein